MPRTSRSRKIALRMSRLVGFGVLDWLIQQVSERCGIAQELLFLDDLSFSFGLWQLLFPSWAQVGIRNLK